MLDFGCKLNNPAHDNGPAINKMLGRLGGVRGRIVDAPAAGPVFE